MVETMHRLVAEEKQIRNLTEFLQERIMGTRPENEARLKQASKTGSFRTLVGFRVEMGLQANESGLSKGREATRTYGTNCG
jgi:hypothetical protein